MKYILTLTLFLFTIVVYADEKLPKFKVSAGVGGPNLVRYNSLFNLYENEPGYKVKGLGPFHLKFEYKFKWWLGLGFNINYANFKISYIAINGGLDPNKGPVDNPVQMHYTSTALNVRSNFYLLNPAKRKTKSELYVGMGLGYKSWDFKVTSQYSEQTPRITFSELYNFGAEVTCGYRYNFNKQLAAYSEIGFAKSILQLGVTGSF